MENLVKLQRIHAVITLNSLDWKGQRWSIRMHFYRLMMVIWWHAYTNIQLYKLFEGYIWTIRRKHQTILLICSIPGYTSVIICISDLRDALKLVSGSATVTTQNKDCQIITISTTRRKRSIIFEKPKQYMPSSKEYVKKSTFHLEAIVWTPLRSLRHVLTQAGCHKTATHRTQDTSISPILVVITNIHLLLLDEWAWIYLFHIFQWL